MNGNLFARLSGAFPDDRKRVLLETPDGARVSFGDILEEAGRFAALFRASGVVPGDRIAVQVEKSVPAVALYLATLQTGAVYVPLNPAYLAAEMAHFLSDAAPGIVVCDPGAEGALAPLARAAGAWVFTLGSDGKGSLTEQAAALPSDRAVALREGSDLAAILYTSGTTGRAKGAMLSNDALWSNANTLHWLWGLRADDVLLHALPLYHTHGLFVALNLMLLNGGRMIFLPRFDAEQMIDLLPRATLMMGVPTYYTRLLASPRLTRAAAASMRLFISGSAPLLASSHAEFEARTGHRILERYGMTETGMSASNPLEGERRPGTVGQAIRGVELRVADARGQELARGEIGVLEVRGPNVFQGYWKLPEKTAEEIRPDGFFITGDLATMGADGYVTIVGRARDLIISGGLNVYPKEVEEVLDALPGVLESAVIGVPHPDLGEAVVAVVAAAGDPGDIVGQLRDRLAGFKLPKRVIVVRELPRNPMGKVQKAALRERHSALFQMAANAAAPGSRS